MNIDRILGFFGLATWLEASNKYQDGVNDERARRRARQQECDLMTVQSMLNRSVICVGNNWENMLIGKVVDIEFITKARNPVPVVRCALTGKDVLTLSKVMPFTMQRFEALSKLNPYERWSLIDNQNEHEFLCLNNIQRPKLLTGAEFLTALKNKGFIDKTETEQQLICNPI